MSSMAHCLAAARLRRADHRHADRTGTLAARFRAAVAEWRRRARSRTQLARLGERDLRDIGLTPMEAAREYAKPFWVD